MGCVYCYTGVTAGTKQFLIRVEAFIVINNPHLCASDAAMHYMTGKVESVWQPRLG